MKSFSSSVSPPKTFCSPGLRKVLIDLQLVLPEEIDDASRVRKNRQALTVLAEKKLLTLEKSLPLLAGELHLELIDFHRANPPAEAGALLEKLGHETALACRILPLGGSETSLRCAMSDPLDLESINQASFLLDADITPVLCAEVQLVDAIRKYQGEEAFAGEEFDQMQEVSGGPELLEVLVAEPEPPKGAEQSAVNAPPIVRLVNRVLADAARVDASDLHLLPTGTNLEIKLRIDGIMQPHLIIPKRLQNYVVSRMKLLAKMDIAERRRPQDGRFRIRLGRGDTRDIRVSSVPTQFGEKLVLRLLTPNQEGLSLESAGLGQEEREKLERALHGTDRIILVVGPTGSGKSTTLYAAVNAINSGSNTIITVEDLVEYRIQGATQIEVDSKIGVTFASGLRSILRQDPDVILVGEIRDLETAEIAFQAAQTGHLVLSTLHTNDAPSAVVRLRDIGLEPYIIAGSLSLVVAQRLVRKLCEECKRAAAEEELTSLRRRLGMPLAGLYLPAGCPACNRTGYKGRVGVFSILEIDSEVRELIRLDEGEAKIEAAGRRSGMKTLGQSALELVLAGITSYEEAERVVGERAMREAALGESRPPQERGSEAAAPAKGDQEPAQTTGSHASVASLAKAINTVDDRGGSSQSIVIIDDDRGVRAVMAASLRKAGFEVTEASNGVEALQLLECGEFDAAVCDLDMPRMNGEALLREIRRHPDLKKLPVLMLTGWDSEEKELDLIEAGANDFVSKSSSPALVIARLRRLIG